MISKRIAAIVLDRLACELAERRRMSVRRDLPPRALAVLVRDESTSRDDDGRSLLDAVDEVAYRAGARPGQTTAAASAYVGKLEVVSIETRALRDALAGVAEVALGMGPVAALELDRPDPPAFTRYPAGAGAGPLDTVWLDVSGCARLLGGEDVLCAELRARIAELGHHARVAVADGPRLARALARWGGVESVAPRGRGAEALAELPIAALPLEGEVLRWLGEVGLWTVSDLARLDRKALAHRLGIHAADVLELVAGRDDVPLRPYAPARRIVELASFDEPLESREPLLFALRGMVARAAVRLAGRGEACGRATLELLHDRAAIALAAREGRTLPPSLTFDLGLPVALAREDDLLRAVRSRLERLEVTAPIGAVTLALDDLTQRSESQLDLSNLSAANPDALPTLLAELVAAVGPTRVGVLELRDSHRPEARSACVPVSLSTKQRKRPRRDPTPDARDSKKEHETVTREGLPQAPTTTLALPHEPTRLLPEPVCIGRISAGALIAAGRAMYLVDHLRLAARLEGVEWWSHEPISRDYARVELRTVGSNGRSEHAEALVFLDRVTGRAFLQGWFE